MRYLLAGIAFAVALGISSARPQTAAEKGDWCRWAAEKAATALALAQPSQSADLVSAYSTTATSYFQVFSNLRCDQAILIQELEKSKVRR
jgi:hypothetical protein